MNIATMFLVLFMLYPLAANASYMLRLYNVDDVFSAYITNSSYSDQLVLQTSFLQDSGLVDISSYVRPGVNDLSLKLYNCCSGYSYAYEFLVDDNIYASGTCGTANVFGCNNDAYTLGDAWTDDIEFNAPSSDNAAPEPTTIALFLGAFGGLLLLLRRHVRLNPTSLVQA